MTGLEKVSRISRQKIFERADLLRKDTMPTMESRICQQEQEPTNASAFRKRHLNFCIGKTRSIPSTSNKLEETTFHPLYQNVKKPTKISINNSI